MGDDEGKNEQVCVKFEDISREEKWHVVEGTRDKWRYKSFTEYKRDLTSKDKLYIIIQLVKRGDNRNEPVALLVGDVGCILKVGQQKSFLIPSVRSPFHFKYWHFSYPNVSTKSIEEGSMEYDLQALVMDSEKVTLVAKDGKEFSISKLLFMARSGVFQAIFENDMKEKKENRVHFEDMDSNALEKLVMFLQTDKVDHMDDTTAHQLGLFCHQYDLPLLFELVEDYFAKNCNKNNAPLVTQLAHLSMSKKLAVAFANAFN